MFEHLSLKVKLGTAELYALVSDAQRRSTRLRGGSGRLGESSCEGKEKPEVIIGPCQLKH